MGPAGFEPAIFAV